MAGALAHPLIFGEGGLIPITSIPAHVLFTWTGMALLFLIAITARQRLTLVPNRLQNFFEVIIGGFEDFVVKNIGEEGRRVYPFIITIFLYVITMNYLGLVPGFDAPTANINTNAALAISVFIYYNYIGIKKWGFGYIKHFLGPVKALAPFMILLELISHLARPLSFTLRLFGNIRGEEIVLMLLFVLAPVVSTVPMYLLFMLAKFIQAFIVLMLTMIYLQGSLDHAH